MAITSYSELKTAIADFIERNDLTSVVDNFIDLCEAEMQRELKLIDFETTTTVSVTSGTGSLPSGFRDLRMLSWATSPEIQLRYVTPDTLNMHVNRELDSVYYYTITGSSIKFADDLTGTANITYKGSFTALSDSNTTNAILTNHPAAYLYGSLVHAAVWTKDEAAAAGYDTLFQRELRAIKKDDRERRYAGPLEVTVR